MTRRLTGRSALLKREIDRLEREDKIIRESMLDFPGSKITPVQPNESLEYLHQELEREIAMKRVVVFGTTHDLQEEGHSQNGALERRLKFLIDKFAATVILEEWTSDRSPSFASVFANCLGLAYKDVGTPPEGEFQTFCKAPITYPGHSGTLGWCPDAPPFYEYGPLDKQENRERRMSQNIQDEMKDHHVGLFIVGLAHLHSISMRIRKATLNVSAYSWIA